MDTNLHDVSPIRYILILEDQTSRRMITLDGDKYTIGRQNESSIILKSRKASRQHATLVRKTNTKTRQYSYWIVDGDLEGKRSHNGIFINGDKCLIHELKDGDLINFGCEVNASYHIMSYLIEEENKINELPPLPPFSPDQTDPDSPDTNDQNTLILSDSHIEKPATLVDDDTFQDQSYLDSVTGLPNQVLLQEYLSIALANTKRNSSILALLLFDIDQFEKINETYGYVVGDQILVNVGELLNDCVRSSDIVARWSGNNFAILLPQLKDLENGEEIQKRILKRLSNPLEIDKFSIVLSVRTALTIYPQHGQDISSLIDDLEHKLQDSSNQPQVKKLPVLEDIKRKQSISMTPDRLTKIEHRLEIALQRQELFLVYQPQINIDTNTVEVMEALLRWKHPQKGFIAPRQFFHLLEQTELIKPTTQWILETACLQNQQWQSSGIHPLTVSINISARQFQHPQFLQLVAQTLTKTGLDPHWLELEITEATVLQNLEQSHQILHSLKELGVYLSLDDFGLGIISISCLQNLPFHKLKIEQSCIRQLTANPENTALISTLIHLGKTFNLQVVAEGVETQQQVEILRNLDCNAMQGYRFCQPLTVEQATQFLQFHLSSEQDE
ncbi:MAG: EAL domain-containing protein [Microcystaceae cyanobacterium]